MKVFWETALISWDIIKQLGMLQRVKWIPNPHNCVIGFSSLVLFVQPCSCSCQFNWGPSCAGWALHTWEKPRAVSMTQGRDTQAPHTDQMAALQEPHTCPSSAGFISLKFCTQSDWCPRGEQNKTKTNRNQTQQKFMNFLIWALFPILLYYRHQHTITI